MLRTKTMAEKKVRENAPKEEGPKKIKTITENLLKNMLEEIPDEEKGGTTRRDEGFDDISFSISNTSDINELYEKMSNKSNEKIDLVYEGNAEEVDKQLNDFVDENFHQFVKDNKGFDPEVKNLSLAFYQDLSGAVVPDLKPRENSTQNDKSKTTNLFTKGPADFTQDEQAIKLKNDLSGVPIMIQGDITQNTGYGKSFAGKLRESESNKQTISSKKEVISNEDKDINIEVKRSKSKKKNNVNKPTGKQQNNPSITSSEYRRNNRENDEDGKGLIHDSVKNSSNLS